MFILRDRQEFENCF